MNHTLPQLQVAYANFVTTKQAAMRAAPAAGRQTHRLKQYPRVAAPEACDQAVIHILLPHALSVEKRYEDIEKPLDDILRDMNQGYVNGGGTGLIGYSDIDVIVHDHERCLDVVLDVLAEVKVPPCTEVSYAARDAEVILQFDGDAWQHVDLDDSIGGFLFMAMMRS
ncbi:MAG: hypothetical protein EOO82_03770 [Oxalobacteraceae bacterium]|nr:MAG: hypothetical protein EOO82_03770 [Oxalobacteraceae bacterium]